MKLKKILESVTSDVMVVAHVGIKRKHRPKKKLIEVSLASLLKNHGVDNFQVNCYEKCRGFRRKQPTINPENINLLFAVGSNYSPTLQQ